MNNFPLEIEKLIKSYLLQCSKCNRYENRLEKYICVNCKWYNENGELLKIFLIMSVSTIIYMLLLFEIAARCRN